ncbi:MAG: hypothetical protein IJW61_01470 [Clostridia bacterium]|nr:hypothetical protein [Clostridia bacterium]
MKRDNFWILEDDRVTTLNDDVSFYDFKYGIISLDKVNLFRGNWKTSYRSEDVKNKFLWYVSANKDFVTEDFMEWIKHNEDAISCDVVYFPIERTTGYLDSYRLDWKETHYKETGYSASGSIDEDSGKISIGISPTYESYTTKEYKYINPINSSTGSWSVFPESSLKGFMSYHTERLDSNSYLPDMRVATSKKLVQKLHNKTTSIIKDLVYNRLRDDMKFRTGSSSDVQWHIGDIFIILQPVWRIKFTYLDQVFVSVFSADLSQYRLAIPYKNVKIAKNKIDSSIAKQAIESAQKIEKKKTLFLCFSIFMFLMWFANIGSQGYFGLRTWALFLSLISLFSWWTCHVTIPKLNDMMSFIEYKYNFKKQNYEINRKATEKYINALNASSLICYLALIASIIIFVVQFAFLL